MSEEHPPQTDEPVEERGTAAPTKVPLQRILIPLLAFTAMLVWSNIPPYRAHIKEEKRSYLVWHWKLYRQGGAKVCDVRYFDMNQGGAPIERWKLLGYERPSQMPDKIRRIHAKQLRGAHGKVCAALREAGDPSPNVEVASRCGFGGGWREFDERERNVCAAKPKAKAKRKSKASGGK